MKAAQMSFDEVMAQLEAWGSEKTRAIYTRMGSGDNQFGVMMGNLRALAKKLKTNHELALQLWATGNTDAQMLAAMIMASDQLSAPEIEGLLAPLTYYRLIDELVYDVIAHTAFADEFRIRWMDSPDEWIGRAGWDLLIARITGDDLDGVDYESVLEKIAAEMKSAPYRKQENMNYCLVEIGVHYPELTQKCIEIAERLGRLDDKPVPKGCTSSYAPEWIAAILRRTKPILST